MIIDIRKLTHVERERMRANLVRMEAHGKACPKVLSNYRQQFDDYDRSFGQYVNTLERFAHHLRDAKPTQPFKP